MPRAMKTSPIAALVFFAFTTASASRAADPAQLHPYRLPSVNIKQPVIWGSTCEAPDGTALSFGGEDRDSDDGLAHTRLRVGGKWGDIRDTFPLDGRQKVRGRVWELRERQKDLLARARTFYFSGLSNEQVAKSSVPAELAQQENQLAADVVVAFKEADMATARHGAVASAWPTVPPLIDAKAGCQRLARMLQESGVTPELLTAMRQLRVDLEQVADALSAEPPARALSPIVYEPHTKRFFLFGGDHGDYLTNDLWVFDPQYRQWSLRHVDSAPPPRANHTWKTTGDGRLVLSGGYTYFSNTDYMGGQYIDLADGDWTYDVGENKWTRGLSPPAAFAKKYGTVPHPAATTRTYRTGPFLPEFFFGTKVPPPDAAAFQAWLAALPANVWTRTNPPRLPQVNRDWGTAVLDPTRDLILRFSGGHCAHGGSDVLQFHLATNRWELCYPVEFPLGQLYDNTEYPGGWNFNHRPWVSGHTYQNYGVDPLSQKMIFLGHSPWGYIYDPDRGDWTTRFQLPRAMDYSGSFYTLTTTATPHGLVCWTQPGDVFLFDARGLSPISEPARGLSPFSESAEKNPPRRTPPGGSPIGPEWHQLKLTGEPLPGAEVDSSTFVYDSHRDRLLFVRKQYGNERFQGEVYSLDMKSLQVGHLSPAGKSHAGDIPYLCQLRYDVANDLLLVGGTLPPGSDGLRRTPAYDCAANKWISLKITGDDPSGHEGRNVSLGLLYDAQRHLFWGCDTHSNVFVLRPDVGSADVKDL